MYDDILLEAEEKMEKAVGVLADELRGVRTGRASAASVGAPDLHARSPAGCAEGGGRQGTRGGQGRPPCGGEELEREAPFIQKMLEPIPAIFST